MIPPIDWMPEVVIPGITADQMNWRNTDNTNHCFDSKTVEDTIACIDQNKWHEFKLWHWSNLCFEGQCKKGGKNYMDSALQSSCDASTDYKPYGYNPNNDGAFGSSGQHVTVATLEGWKANPSFPLFSECVERLRESDFYVSKTFQTPTLVVVVLTLLNDFTVLTIAFDHVEISKKPDKWFLWRNIAIGTIIGANTLFWSVLMFLFMLGSLDPTNTQFQTFGINLEYPECITGAFLQLSLCARLARTNARTEGWFCRLALHRSVVCTMTFSIVAAITLGFTWPFCSRDSRNCDPHMSPLNPKQVALIILYQIPVHIIRDICKQALWRFFNNQDLVNAETRKLEIEKIDNDCKAILREMELDVNSGVGKNSNVANSVTLQAIDRERSGKFTHMNEDERIKAAQDVTKNNLDLLAKGETRAMSKEFKTTDPEEVQVMIK